MSTTKERSIIFTGENVRKILDGTKTQTRRIVKNAHIISADDRTGATDANCPYGSAGDFLWVKTSWQTWAEYDGLPPNKIPNEAMERINFPSLSGTTWKSRMRSPLHLPRWASRLALEITDVRVQRVQEIGKDGRRAADVLAEGITREQIAHQQKFFHPDDSPAIAFACLWDRINGKGSWKSNPWVWAISFRKATP